MKKTALLFSTAILLCFCATINAQNVVVDDGETSVLPGTWKSATSGNEYEVRNTPEGFKYVSKKDPNSFASFKVSNYPNFVCTSVSGETFSQMFIGSTANYDNGILKIFNNETKKSYNLVKISSSFGQSAQVQQPAQNNTANAYQGQTKTESKINPDNKAVQIAVTKEDETEKIRQDWLAKGGSMGVNSFSASYTYVSMSGEYSELTGNGINLNFTTNHINLKMPDFNAKSPNWSSFLFGLSGALGYQTASMSMNFTDEYGYDNSSEISMTMLTAQANLNIGFTLGLGKFLSPTNWKGVAIDFSYKPAWVYTQMMFEDSEQDDPEGTSDFNFSGFGVDFNFSNFNSSMNKLAPKAQSKLSFMYMPETDETPMMFSIGYGLVWYNK
jgi:hypothetical protein